MSNIVEQTFVNNTIENIGVAIEDVGGDVSQVCCACEYPDVIREQLTTKGEGLKFNPGEGIEIAKEGNSYTISSNSDALLTNDLKLKTQIKKGESIQKALETVINDVLSTEASTTSPLSPPYPNDMDIPEGTTFQKVFEKLFDEILPAVPSILKGDIILSSETGEDIYTHPKHPEPISKTGLDPKNHYMRITLASQIEPIYISCEPLLVKYKGSENKDITINVDNTTNTISAVIKSVPAGSIPPETVDTMVEENKMEAADAEKVFKEVFK